VDADGFANHRTCDRGAADLGRSRLNSKMSGGSIRASGEAAPTKPVTSDRESDAARPLPQPFSSNKPAPAGRLLRDGSSSGKRDLRIDAGR
jgi:hypothetical protein